MTGRDRRRVVKWMDRARRRVFHSKRVARPDRSPLLVTPAFFDLLAEYLAAPHTVRRGCRLEWDSASYVLAVAENREAAASYRSEPIRVLPLTDPRAAFLLTIEANAADDLPWLVFADWLDEHGDPLGATIRREVAGGPRLTRSRSLDMIGASESLRSDGAAQEARPDHRQDQDRLAE